MGTGHVCREQTEPAVHKCTLVIWIDIGPHLTFPQFYFMPPATTPDFLLIYLQEIGSWEEYQINHPLWWGNNRKIDITMTLLTWFLLHSNIQSAKKIHLSSSSLCLECFYLYFFLVWGVTIKKLRLHTEIYFLSCTKEKESLKECKIIVVEFWEGNFLHVIFLQRQTLLN